MDEAGKAAAAASGCSRRGSGEMSCRRPGERVGEGLGNVAGRSIYSGGDMGGAGCASGVSMRLGDGRSARGPARDRDAEAARRKAGQARAPGLTDQRGSLAGSAPPPPRVRARSRCSAQCKFRLA